MCTIIIYFKDRTKKPEKETCATKQFGLARAKALSEFDYVAATELHEGDYTPIRF